MPTFVVHTRKTSTALLRVVSLFHSRAISIERLRAEPADAPNTLRITIEAHVNTEGIPRIEASLFRIVDVLSVQM